MTDKDRKIIEDAERDEIPIFVLTAKDNISLETILSYFNECIKVCEVGHVDGIFKRLKEFAQWQTSNQDKVKLPD